MQTCEPTQCNLWTDPLAITLFGTFIPAPAHWGTSDPICIPSFCFGLPSICASLPMKQNMKGQPSNAATGICVCNRYALVHNATLSTPVPLEACFVSTQPSHWAHSNCNSSVFSMNATHTVKMLLYAQENGSEPAYWDGMHQFSTQQLSWLQLAHWTTVRHLLHPKYALPSRLDRILFFIKWSSACARW